MTLAACIVVIVTTVWIGIYTQWRREEERKRRAIARAAEIIWREGQ
jgi:hypothetical protein